MKNFKLLTSAICLISVFVLVGMVGKAHGLAWKGFSELCYEGDFKGPEGVELRINLINFTVQAQCWNTATGDLTCQPGVGNGGGWNIITYPTTDPNADKTKGTVHVEGCLPLEKYDHHYMEDGETVNPNHIHICWPYDNKNKVEIEDSAYISSIQAEYELINLQNGKVITRGYQECTWPGTIDPDTCLPNTVGGEPIYFICPIDEVYKK